MMEDPQMNENMDDAQAKMNEHYEAVVDQTDSVMGELLASADVNAVFGEPIEQGDYLIIPAAEVMAVAGFGMGSGSGSGPDEQSGKNAGGSGAGGGGGGRVFSRPVAVIVAGPHGVEVQPVFDMTKIALAALTALGFMMATAAKMRRGKF